jgi:HK97 family phage portal protein
MAIRDILQNLFKKDVTQIRGSLPFIHTFGHERTFGKMVDQNKHDFTRQVEHYRSWVYACAWKNATSVAKTKLRLFQTQMVDEEEELTQIGDHPFLDIFKGANPFQNRFELMTITQIFMELTGNAYWWIPKDPFGQPEAIWNVPSHWMAIAPSKTQFIAGYIMTVPGKGEKIPFQEDEIIHFKFPSPFDLHYGTGPLLAAAYGIDLNENMKSWGINFFNNNAEPAGVLLTENPTTDEEFKRFQDNWNRKHRGTKNAGKIAILSGALKYEKIGSSIKDATFDKMSREVRDELLAMFGVPASKLGLVEDVNRANADANDYSYQKETVLPRLTLIEEKINEKFLPYYDVDLVAKFDNPVPEDKEFRLKEQSEHIRVGYSSIDDERLIDGLEEYNQPETQSPLIPFNVIPAGEEKPEPNIVQPQEEKALKAQADRKWKVFAKVTQPQERLFEQTLKRFFGRQQKVVMGNLNNYKAFTKDLFTEITFDLGEQDQILFNFSENHVRQAYETGLTLGMEDTNTTIDFNLFNPNIERAVNERLNFFATSVNQSTLRSLKNEINEGIKQGESIQKIAGRIDSVYGFSRDFRSKRIAQTEVIGATNDGQLRAYMEAGVEQKEWLTAGDEKVRDSHQINGQRVPVTESFRTNAGNILNYPGDRQSGAPAEEVINCRCTVLPVIRGA